MKRRRRNAFSLLEVIAAVVILAVVAAATVATVAPMRQKSTDKLNEQDRANIAAMTQTYFV
ncbi:MAG: prepilin-type N-terminal cleavage/methylation domain-containing protein, partial [Planctomycetota bacterium]